MSTIALIALGLAFVSSCGLTLRAIAEGSERYQMIGLACMIASAIMIGNAAGAIAGTGCS